MGLHGTIHIQRPKVNIGCLPQFIFISLRSEFTNRASLARQLALSIRFLPNRGSILSCVANIFSILPLFLYFLPVSSSLSSSFFEAEFHVVHSGLEFTLSGLALIIVLPPLPYVDITSTTLDLDTRVCS